MLAGLHKCYWLDLPEKKIKSLAPTSIILNFESDLDDCLDTGKNIQDFPILLITMCLAGGIHFPSGLVHIVKLHKLDKTSLSGKCELAILILSDIQIIPHRGIRNGWLNSTLKCKFEALFGMISSLISKV